MTLNRKIVAVITGSPALGSIITMMLEGQNDLHAQRFDDFESVVTHMRIAPVDLIVCDYQLETGSALDLVAKLRRLTSNRQYQMIVLVDQITREIKLGCKFANVDEVIVKPMSPVFLNERILFRLGKDGAQYGDIGRGQEPQRLGLSKATINSCDMKSHLGDNVVPLFASQDPRFSGPGDIQHPS